MIQIDDNDLPITVAQKLITGTRPNNPTPLMRAMGKALTGEEDACETIDMFTLEEIEEIVRYLSAYISSHKDGDV